MIADFVLEIVSSPGVGTITLPGVAPTGRLTWALGFTTSQPVFYILDDSTQQEWGVGFLTVGSPSTITRDATPMGNSLGTFVPLNFTDNCRCYPSLPSDTALTMMAGGIARNLFHNGMDRVQQRGVGPWTTGSYTSDRWWYGIGGGGGSRSVAISALADVGRTQIGDEEAQFCISTSFTGGTGSTDAEVLRQELENVRRTAGKTVTVSFWANATVAGLKIGVTLSQFFGSGGTPSTTVATPPQTVTLSTTWTRYSLTFAMPSVNGKVFGTTAGTDYLQVWFYFSAGSGSAPGAGVGVQSGAINIFGRQLELGSVATPLEKQDINYDRDNCLRFFQNFTALLFGGTQTSGTTFYGSWMWPVPFRATPTITLTTLNYSPISGSGALNTVNFATLGLQAVATGTGSAWCSANGNASADL
jgi:hypothetical protein